MKQITQLFLESESSTLKEIGKKLLLPSYQPILVKFFVSILPQNATLD